MTRLFMQTLQKLGHKAAIVEKNFSKQQEEVGNVTILKAVKVPGLVLKLLRQLITDKPDICFYFISMGSISFLFDALLIALLRLFGVEYILYCHGKGFRKLERKSGPLMRYVVKFVLAQALSGLVLGDRLKAGLNRHLPDRKLFILPNAIYDAKEPPKKSEVSRPVQILYLSNLVPSKGVMEFVKMAGIVRKHIPNTRFVLAGNFRSNDFSQQVDDCIDREQLRACMDIPGAVYGKDKEKLFQESDIFVFPTYYELETFGLVNLEAMRSGLPVVSTPEGAIPEVVCDGITGFIVNPHDIEQLSERVLKLVEDRELRIAMGQAGRKRFEQYYTTEAYERRLKEAIHFFSLLLQEKHGIA
jgi:glycosyltransferase involved in cell wall biosynthesis